MIMFRIISRRSWDQLHARREACPGSRVEHLMHGLYVLHLGGGEAARNEADEARGQP